MNNDGILSRAFSKTLVFTNG
uniref:Uncharacterized protein n=1 Tax=Rhizophora mucronata TaxID=61149 RepID=A0A2P2PE71_RHIMU